MNLRKIGIICNLITLLFVARELHALPQNQTLYVGAQSQTGGQPGVVYAFNTANNSPLANITLPAAPEFYNTPFSMAVTADGKHAYIVGNTVIPFNVLYYNLTSNGLVETIPTSITHYTPGLLVPIPRIALTPDGKYLLVTNYQQLSIINTATNTEVTHVVLPGLQKATGASPAYPIAISPIFSTSYTVFIAIAGDRYPTFNTNVLPLTINVSTGIPTLGTAFPVGVNENNSIAITPDGSTLYVGNTIGSAVHVFLYPVNTSTFAVGTPISIPITNSQQSPVSIGILPNGATAYVVTGNLSSAGNVNVINLNTQSFTQTIAGAGGLMNGDAIQCAFSADSSYFYVPNFHDGTGFAKVQVINTATNTLATQISVLVSVGGGLGLYFAAIGPRAAGGTLDTTFGNQGYTLTPLSRADTVQDLAIQSNDEILITGTTQAITSSSYLAPSLYLARYTANGILDSSFNAGSTPGYFTLAPTALIPTASACAGNAVNLDASQNILVAGYAAQSPTTMLLARFTSTGILDTTFNSGGALPGVVTQSVGTGEGVTAASVGVQSTAYHSGRIIVAGTSINNGIPSFTLAAFTSAGALDTSFGGSGTGYRIDTFGNVSILKAMVIPGISATYVDDIFVTGIVDNQAVVAWYDPTGNLLSVTNIAGKISDPNDGDGPTISSSAAYDIAYIDAVAPGGPDSELYIAGSAIEQGNTITQSLIANMNIINGAALDLNPHFNFIAEGPSGFILSSLTPQTGNNNVIQPLGAGSEFYSVTVQSGANIIAGGYGVGALANQLSLVSLAGFEMSDNEDNGSLPYGTPNTYWNNGNGVGISLNTIGTLTAAQRVRCQSTGSIIAAGTADGTYYVARFNG